MAALPGAYRPPARRTGLAATPPPPPGGRPARAGEPSRGAFRRQRAEWWCRPARGRSAPHRRTAPDGPALPAAEPRRGLDGPVGTEAGRGLGPVAFEERGG